MGRERNISELVEGGNVLTLTILVISYAGPLKMCGYAGRAR